jgi:type I restriction enzyme S subunit
MENGKVAYLEKLVNGIGFGSTEFHVSRPTSSVSGKYLFYNLVQQIFRKEAKRSMTGSAGQLRVSTNYFAEQPLPLAPLPEQRAIISKIELLFSELDNGIDNLKLAQEQLMVYRQAVLKKAFDGELTKKWREQQTNLQDARDILGQIRVEREEAAKVSGKKQKPIKPLTEAGMAVFSILPKEWEWIKLGKITESMKNGIYKEKEFYSEDGIACLRMYNIENGKIQWFDIKRMILTESEINEYGLITGDLLVNRVNSRELVGKTAVIPENMEFSVYESKNIRLRLNPNINSKLVNYWFLLSANKYFNRNAQQTVGMASINQDQLGNFEYPLCPLPEQHYIVQEIETRLSICDKVEWDIEENLIKAEALRQSILKKAFEGKLLNESELAEVRRAQDWEPAGILLEWVKAEKAGNNKYKKKG